MLLNTSFFYLFFFPRALWSTQVWFQTLFFLSCASKVYRCLIRIVPFYSPVTQVDAYRVQPPVSRLGIALIPRGDYGSPRESLAVSEVRPNLTAVIRDSFVTPSPPFQEAQSPSRHREPIPMLYFYRYARNEHQQLANASRETKK